MVKSVDLSVAIPLYNEEGTVPELYHRLTTVLKSTKLNFEIICVNDGSLDKTLDCLTALQKKDPHLKILSLSRNFGHEAAATAALEHTSGQTVILMDGDLQDPPELIPALLEKINQGYDVVFARHTSRHDPVWKKFVIGAFYLVIEKLSHYKLPTNAGIFSAMRRPAVQVLCALSERNRYLAGLRTWIGFRQIGVDYIKERRFQGAPKQSFTRLLKMGLDAVFSFSYIPLRLTAILGLLVSFGAFLAILQVLYQKFVTNTAILGWTSELISILLIGGVQLITLGIIGEYLGRIYDEVKRRPYYIVSQKYGF